MDGTLLALLIVLFGVFVLGGVLFGAMNRRGSGEPMTQATAEMVGPQYTTGTDYVSKELYSAVPQSMELRELTGEQRQSYSDRWRVLQAGFPEDPEATLRSVDVLAREVLEARGYDPEALEPDEPGVVLERSATLDDYRAARVLVSAHEIEPEEGTHDLEEALGHYRELFEELLQSPPRAA